jgi:hypothetical protein
MDYQRLLEEAGVVAGGVSACRQFPSKELTDTCHGFPCSPLR